MTAVINCKREEEEVVYKLHMVWMDKKNENRYMVAMSNERRKESRRVCPGTTNKKVLYTLV
jgi:hypothetical protein